MVYSLLIIAQRLVRVVVYSIAVFQVFGVRHHLLFPRCFRRLLVFAHAIVLVLCSRVGRHDRRGTLLSLDVDMCQYQRWTATPETTLVVPMPSTTNGAQLVEASPSRTEEGRLPRLALTTLSPQFSLPLLPPPSLPYTSCRCSDAALARVPDSAARGGGRCSHLLRPGAPLQVCGWRGGNGNVSFRACYTSCSRVDHCFCCFCAV